MARGVNKVILIGNLGADPELRYTASGTAVAKFRIATTEVFNDKQGNRQERTDWHRITAWASLPRSAVSICPKDGRSILRGAFATIPGSRMV